MNLSNSGSKGKVILIGLILGIVMGFGGWIQSEYGTVKQEHTWAVVGIVGAVLALGSLAWLAASSGDGGKNQ